MPSQLGWCDVTQVSNGVLSRPEDAITKNHVVDDMLVDVVDGDRDFLYRRHLAEWLRVVPFEEVNSRSASPSQLNVGARMRAWRWMRKTA